MKISILTICPEMFSGFYDNHVIRRAMQLEKLELEIVDIRTFVKGSFRKVDDSPYGGGPGMIMRVAPVMDAFEAVISGEDRNDVCMAVLSPVGKRYCQKDAQELLSRRHLVLVCGHYEGMDARICDHADRLISVGDYILSGGEIASMAVTDSIVRLIPGVLREESLAEESFSAGLLEYPQYTRPADYHGEKVPEVLLSGDHEAIREWRRQQALRITKRNRPDLLDRCGGCSRLQGESL